MIYLNISFRIHLASSDGNGWSGEIPLHATSAFTPWLVKVPSKSKNKYISFSVRIHRENIDDGQPQATQRKPQRVLIVIWPLFTVRSMLPVESKALDLEAEREYSLAGKGQLEDLQIAGTYDTEHEFMFSMV